MPLTREQERRIERNIQQLDYLEGTGVLSDSRKELANEIFVFISAGGAGCKALQVLKRTIAQKVEASEIKKRIMYLAVDTAHKELDELVKEGIFEDNEILKIPFEKAHDSISPEKLKTSSMAEWVNPDLWKQTDGTHTQVQAFNGTGAGAIRQCGRVLFCQSGLQNDLVNRLRRIHHMLGVVGGTPKVRIFFLAGIAGGTGSGSIIDLTYLCRHLLRTAVLGNAIYERTSFQGYIFLPSACSDDVQDLNDIQNGNTNAYAALKEIDYFMTITSRGERFKMNYGTVNAALVDIGDNIFDFCTLVDGSGAQGVVINKPAETAKQIVADSILNIICSNNLEKIAGEDVFMVDSFLSNQTQQVETRCRLHLDTDWPRDTNYIYSVIGFSACVVPVDLLTVYVAKKVFDRVWDHFEKCQYADRSSAAAFLARCRMDIDGLEHTWNIYPNPEALCDELQKELDKDFLENGPYYMINLTKELCSLIDEYKREAAEKKNSVFARLPGGQEKWGRIISIYEAAREHCHEQNNSLYSVYNKVIQELQGLLEKNGKLLTDANEFKTMFGNRFRWCPIDLTKGNDASKAVEAYLNSLVDEKIDTLAYSFVEELLNKKDEWTQLAGAGNRDLGKFDPAGVIRTFVREKFQDCINTTIESFVVKSYSGNSAAQVTDIDPGTGQEVCSEDTLAAAQQIFNRLNNDAVPLSSVEGTFLSNAYSNIYLTVPATCKYLYDALGKAAAAAPANLGEVHLFKTSSNDSIILSRLYAGIPAWVFGWTKGAEEQYEVATPHQIGLHMDQGSNGTDWGLLPNLYPEKKWSSADREKRSREAKISASVHADMQSAKELDLLSIPEKKPDQYNILLIPGDDDAETLLKKADLSDKKKYTLREVLEILKENGALEEFEIQHTHQLMILGSGQTPKDPDAFRLDMAARTIRRYRERFQQLHRNIPVFKALQELNASRAVVSTDVVTDFINALDWEIIKYNRRKAIWTVWISAEEAMSSPLETKIEKICAIYHGFKAFSALDADTREEIRDKCRDLKENADDAEFDAMEKRHAELKEALTKLKDSKKGGEVIFPDTSPFKDSNGSQFPMGSMQFAEEIGNATETEAIRGFYQTIVNQM